MLGQVLFCPKPCMPAFCKSSLQTDCIDEQNARHHLGSIVSFDWLLSPLHLSKMQWDFRLERLGLTTKLCQMPFVLLSICHWLVRRIEVDAAHQPPVACRQGPFLISASWKLIRKTLESVHEMCHHDNHRIFKQRYDLLEQSFASDQTDQSLKTVARRYASQQVYIPNSTYQWQRCKATRA